MTNLWIEFEKEGDEIEQDRAEKEACEARDPRNRDDYDPLVEECEWGWHDLNAFGVCRNCGENVRNGH